MANKLIIDGDLLAYRFAAAVEKRTVIVKHLGSGKEKEYKTRTEFKEFLKKAGKEFDDEKYSFTDVQTPEDISHAANLVKKMMNRLLEFTGYDEHELYLGGGETFRHKLSLPVGYKNNREDNLRPIHLTAVRQYMNDVWRARTVEDYEVDDVVTIRSYEEHYKGNKPILVSVDKDSYQSQEIRVLNWLEDEWKIVNIPIIGHLRKDKSSVKGDGLKFLAFQVLAGDDADTYWGYKLSHLKYGKSYAMKALENANTEQEIINVMVSEYKRLYPEPVTYVDCHGVEVTKNYMQLLEMYWKVAYMKRSWNDPSDVYDFCMERGLSI